MAVKGTCYDSIMVCQCNSLEHQMATYLPEDENVVYVYIHLVPEYSIWKRIKNAVKYIFGYKSAYGEFDEFILTKDHIDDLERVVTHLKREL